MQLSLFADNVSAHAEDRKMIQLFLDEAGDWVAQYGMCWSTQKCFVIQHFDSEAVLCTLSNEGIAT